MVDEFVNGLSGYLQGSYLLAYLAVYLGGVLISFTPCVYPIIPVTVSFIGAQGRGSLKQGFIQTVIYVLGMAATYTILGAVASLTGMLFGRIQTSPWTFFLMGNLCLLMGLSMLDVFSFRVRMPSFVTRMQGQRKTHSVAGSFLVGAASGLIVGPCTAPVLAVVLGYAATKQNLLFASSLLFVFAVGMGSLLILVGTFTSLLAGIPKSGPWMVRVSRAFGWIFLGTGEYFLINAGMLWV